jgi:plastocyanin
MKPLGLPLLLASLTATTGCGGYDKQAAPPGPNDVVMTEYRFEPRIATVKRGAELNVRNDGQIAHDLTLEQSASDQRLIGTDTFSSGNGGTLRVDLPPGRYKIVCTVPGHEQRGMVGTLGVR